jgi:hypothetical protein
MHLHRGFGDAHLAGNLLVQPALCDLNQNRALTRSQYFESCPEHAQGFFILAARTVSSEPGRYKTLLM